jgi:hypothetical protein
MKPVLPYLVFLISLLLFPALASADIIYPLGNQYFGFDYDRMYRAGVQSGDVSSLPPVGPFFLNIARDLTQETESASIRMLDVYSSGSYFPIGSQADDRIRLFSSSSETFRVTRRQRPDDLPQVIGGFAYRPGKHFGALSFFSLDRARAIDPDYTGKKYRGLAGDIETAALFFRKNKISMTLGRSHVFWGPQRVNLLLSETAEPFDLISASYEKGSLAFNFLFARLDGSHPDEVDSLYFPDRTFIDNRYLVGHRLDLKLHSRFRMGFFETILYGGEGRPPELYYLNPLQFFHGAQLNEDQDDNTILGFDFTFLPGRKTSIYGQLIVDDFQIDNESQGDQEPNELGFMLGLFKAGRTGSPIPDVKLEYVRLTNRTYHQRDPRNRYLYRNRLIGHPLGPDADSTSMALRFWPGQFFFAEIEVAYRRKGEGSIYKPWDEPWELVTGEYSEPFPTGVVEKAALAALRIQGYVPFSRYTRDHFFLSLAAGWGEIRNRLNIAGDTEIISWMRASLTWLGFTDIMID